ncbi:hypothetical protein EJ06DRAFT_584881 [Trichodelitschia bisporula]|uniref:Uncharacterized protein n=1 Tax=Trichodelitschia bisporula TaxID=703511 RepID=A0A6G1HM26_9PEZI|nr:hypothetical protein EJ06DRAFT_584881 [Trichodelitschia bisporula]
MMKTPTLALALSLAAHAPLAAGASSYANTTSISTSTLPAPPGSCTGCTVNIFKTTLSYPGMVREVTTTQKATIVPYLYIYPNGETVTSFSTYAVYTSSATAQKPLSTPEAVTWTTLGVTLTYPTTYVAFTSPLAGSNKPFTGGNAFCYASLTTIPLPAPSQARLIFPVDVPDPRPSVSAFLDALPAVSAAVGGDPSSCVHEIGGPARSPLLTSSSTLLGAPSGAPAVTHTSVQVLAVSARAVIVKATGAPPAAGQQGGGSSGSGGSGGGGAVGGDGGGGVIVLPSTTLTAGPGGTFVVNGQTLSPGGSGVVVGGQTVSVAPGGGEAVIGTRTVVITQDVAPSGGGIGGAVGSGIGLQSGMAVGPGIRGEGVLGVLGGVVGGVVGALGVLL